MVEMLEQLTSIESPSSDPAATERCAKAAADLAHAELGVAGDLVVSGGRSHLRLAVGQPRVLLVGHIDTVWPTGTLDRWPFQVEGDRATGPGTFDMKAGVVQGLFALAALDDLDGVAVLLTSDEELGSPSSRILVEEKASGCAAVLVLEPSADAALKIARKGVSNYVVHLEGRASHAGLNPADGVNATVEAAHQVLAIEDMGRSAVGTTVTPTVLASGTVMNVVPAEAA